MTVPVTPQSRESADERIQQLEARLKALRRQRQIAESIWAGGSGEHKARIQANEQVTRAVEDELNRLRSAQGRMAQRQQTIREIGGSEEAPSGTRTGYLMEERREFLPKRKPPRPQSY